MSHVQRGVSLTTVMWNETTSTLSPSAIGGGSFSNVSGNPTQMGNESILETIEPTALANLLRADEGSRIHTILILQNRDTARSAILSISSIAFASLSSISFTCF